MYVINALDGLKAGEPEEAEGSRGTRSGRWRADPGGVGDSGAGGRIRPGKPGTCVQARDLLRTGPLRGWNRRWQRPAGDGSRGPGSGFGAQLELEVSWGRAGAGDTARTRRWRRGEPVDPGSRGGRSP
ncbi:hypothetical protein NDU88_001524 [Pleurodeles waltl]|uniref:Uncharacterized protein n=1 Tax=Pleurodeles waltl TaxID=8319 RepID=A0AAV7LDF2_PLEWA|nr:hypothetical protein NDU88_001524 [Pleurodeles waltl]